MKFGFRYISRVGIKVWHSFWFRFEIRNLVSVGNYCRVIVTGPCTTTFSIAMQFYIFVFLLDLIGECCRSIKQVGRRGAQESHESGGSQWEIVWGEERLLWGWNLRDGQERSDDTVWTASKNYQNKSFPFCLLKHKKCGNETVHVMYVEVKYLLFFQVISLWISRSRLQKWGKWKIIWFCMAYHMWQKKSLWT